MKKIAFLFLLLYLASSCRKEDIDPRHITYQAFLDNMVLDCPEDTSQYYFKAIINGQQNCYYDGIDGKRMKFAVTSKFTTPGPSFTSGDTISDARRGARINFKDFSFQTGEDYFEIKFPCFPLNQDTVAYLDSLFAIKQHRIRTSLEEEEKFAVILYMIDVAPGTNSGLFYPISSEYGPQDNSFLRFRKVEKTIEDDIVHYYIEAELECKLYHWEQLGKEGLWANVEQGVLVVKFSVK
ncbi:MAG: hypothetical protein AAF990_24840 [Bacteroidota bacterium]